MTIENQWGPKINFAVGPQISLCSPEAKQFRHKLRQKYSIELTKQVVIPPPIQYSTKVVSLNWDCWYFLTHCGVKSTYRDHPFSVCTKLLKNCIPPNPVQFCKLQSHYNELWFYFETTSTCLNHLNFNLYFNSMIEWIDEILPLDDYFLPEKFIVFTIHKFA